MSEKELDEPAFQATKMAVESITDEHFPNLWGEFIKVNPPPDGMSLEELEAARVQARQFYITGAMTGFVCAATTASKVKIQEGNS